MRAAFAYEQRPGPLGNARPSVAALYLGPLAAAAFAFSNPLILLGVLAAALVAAAGSRALASALAPMRFGAYLAISIVVVNAIASQRGETILLRLGELPLLGQVNVSAEALAEGGVLALRILAALAVFAVWSACVDPDRILRAVRPWASRSALTATLISRLVPLAAADAVRLGEASRLRGPAAEPVGRAAIARRLIAGSLDRSVDVAATLELRGYALPDPPRSARSDDRSPYHRGERRLLLAALLMAAALVAAAVAGSGGFSSYPTVSIDLGAETFALALALPLLAALPFGDSSG